MAEPLYISPPAVAEQLGVDPAKILGWIRRGELQAVNVATVNTSRPRWRISQDAIEEFLVRRQATPTPKPAKRRRRSSAEVIEFF